MKVIPTSIAILVIVATAAYGEDKTSLVKKGAKPLTGSEKAILFPGRTLKGTSYDASGKKVATWTVQYQKNGTKITNVSGKKIERKWWIEGSKFCEQLTGSGETTCADGPYKLASKCYTFHSNGAIQNEMGC